jgi:hypothetical protein
MKTGPEALGTAENEFGRAKHENGTRRLRFCRKHVRERKTCKRDPTHSGPPKTCHGAENMKMGLETIGTAENETGHTKHESGTRRTRHRQKRVRERKT